MGSTPHNEPGAGGDQLESLCMVHRYPIMPTLEAADQVRDRYAREDACKCVPPPRKMMQCQMTSELGVLILYVYRAS